VQLAGEDVDDDEGSELTDAPSSNQEEGEEPDNSSTEMEDTEDEEESMVTAPEGDGLDAADTGADVSLTSLENSAKLCGL